MNQFVQLPASERKILIVETATRLNLSPIVVEKDFWVCWLLGCIFRTREVGAECVFKGGTSLSKVFGAIKRFSEDIDLSVNPAVLGWDEAKLDHAPSSSQRQKRMKKLEDACIIAVEQQFRPILETVACDALGPRLDGTDWLTFQIDPASNSPVLLFNYLWITEAMAAYISPVVKMEFGSLTDQRPTGSHSIRPLLAEMVPEAFADFTSEVVALELERSFWEKATILHAEYFRPQHQPLRERFARHYADFASLWQHPSGQTASRRLDLLERVAIHKGRFFGSSWANYEQARPGSLRLVPQIGW